MFFSHPNSKSATKIAKERCSNEKFSTDSMVDDLEDFARLENALNMSGISGEKQVCITGIYSNLVIILIFRLSSGQQLLLFFIWEMLNSKKT